jgi:hypothetical protein
MLNMNMDVSPTTSTLFAPSMAAGIGKLPSTKRSAVEEEDDEGGAKAKKGKGGKDTGPIDPVMIDMIFPILSIEQEVPSLLRMQQMQQAEAIREAFVQQGVKVPIGLIEKGLFTPEDRPFVECMVDLPPPEVGLCRDFTKAKPKKGKK